MSVHPINRALAFVEAHLREDFRVEEIARASAISRYHLNRVFAAATGYSLWRYVMLRRLTEAAMLLRQSDQDILHIALAVGYDSHSVFSRAFRAEFGISPSEFRRVGAPHPLPIVQPIIWSVPMNITVATPQEKHGLSLTAVGTSRQFRAGDDMAAGHTELSKAFLPRISEIPHPLSSLGYIQMSRDAQDDRNFIFFMGITVSEVGDDPKEMERVDVSWDRYLVFSFSVESAGLGEYLTAICAEWFPNHAQGAQPVGGDNIQSFKANPAFETLEPGRAFPPSLQLEGEVWVPVRS